MGVWNGCWFLGDRILYLMKLGKRVGVGVRGGGWVGDLSVYWSMDWD